MDRPEAWEHYNPTRIVFGLGSLDALARYVPGRTLLVTTAGHARRGLARRVCDELGAEVVVFDRVETNPSIRRLVRTIEQTRRQTFQTVVALGGGSAIDTAKVMRAALANKEFELDAALAGGVVAAEVLGPRLVAVPTTAGTGSEVTPTATLWDGDARRKRAISGPGLFPDVAVVDPKLAVGLPWEVTLASGLDAYAQCFEAIWNRNATAVTTPLAVRGLRLVPDALRRLRSNSASVEARTAMAEAALLSGVAISQTRTGLAHSMSYPVTARLGLPHGMACALFLPAVMEYTLEADDGRLAQVDESASAASVVGEVYDLFSELGVPDAIRARIGRTPDLLALAGEMLTPGRADNNLRTADLTQIGRLLTDTMTWLRDESRQ